MSETLWTSYLWRNFFILDISVSSCIVHVCVTFSDPQIILFFMLLSFLKFILNASLAQTGTCMSVYLHNTYLKIFCTFHKIHLQEILQVFKASNFFLSLLFSFFFFLTSFDCITYPPLSQNNSYVYSILWWGNHEFAVNKGLFISCVTPQNFFNIFCMLDSILCYFWDNLFK